MAAAVPISGLTARQGLFDHAGLKTGQTVLIHGAAGGVGSMAVQLAHELGPVVSAPVAPRTGRLHSGWARTYS